MFFALFISHHLPCHIPTTHLTSSGIPVSFLQTHRSTSIYYQFDLKPTASINLLQAKMKLAFLALVVFAATVLAIPSKQLP